MKHTLTAFLWLTSSAIFAQTTSTEFFKRDFVVIKRLADERNAPALVQAFGKSDRQFYETRHAERLTML
ncbi:MAG: hypothetical protein ACK4XY_01535 [Chloroherpetonaceae bacterium]